MTEPGTLTDIGANLGNPAFANDLDEVLARAGAAGVRRIIVTGTSLQSSREALAMRARAPGMLWSTAGVHPHEASSLDSEVLHELELLAGQPGVVAVGETGLDFNRNYSPPAVQESAFRAQLALASRVGKPLFLHERDAFDLQRACLREWRDRLSGGVAHCFTGDRRALDAYLELDLYIGITGWICDERRGLQLREEVARIPSDRLLLETDAPYLLPRTLKPKPAGRRNEPAYLCEVLRIVAAARGESEAELAATTSANASRLFGLP